MALCSNLLPQRAHTPEDTLLLEGEPSLYLMRVYLTARLVTWRVVAQLVLLQTVQVGLSGQRTV
jgi:hypothetical protein